MTAFRPLPDDDDALILRSEAHHYGYPRPATFAKWASRPTEAPCELPYILVGRSAAYTVRTLRSLREALTFVNTSVRGEARSARSAAQSAQLP